MIESVMVDNIKLAKRELIKTTGCEKPKIVPIPFLFRHNSIFPNIINGVVQTGVSGASSYIAPKPFYDPIENYVSSEMKKIGVPVTYIHDLQYHFGGGEIHCGTNNILVCDPGE